MENIFGTPVTSIMMVLLVVFGLCMLTAIWIGIRHRVVFRMGMRNIPRRPAQTILIIVGLMLSTLIIAAAFTTGDTLNNSIRSQVYDILGPVDQIVVLSTGEDADAARPQSGVTFPETIAYDLADRMAGDPDVAGIIPVHSERVPVINPLTGDSEPALSLVGLPVSGLEPFGGITDLAGHQIDLATLPDNGIVLGETPAENLNAAAGDTLVIYIQNQPYELVVYAIGPDSILTGTQDPGDPGGFTMPLERAQSMFGRDGQINYVAVTNRGGDRDGVRLTDSAVASLNSALAGTPYQAVPVKQQSLEMAEEAANMFLSLFLIFGMFSISVGILLIFLIFVMLAAERQPEMGMARAVGMRRRQLVQMFIAEGMGYNLVSAMVGALLGVAVAFIMVRFMASIFADFLEIQPAVTWTSLVVSYTLGVTVTFLTIVGSSWRVSKLNIVSAIRNTPEPARKRAGRRSLVYGLVGTVIGSLLIWVGYQNSQEVFFGLGLSIVPFGLAVALRHFGLAPRLVYSLASILVLAYWLMPMDAHQRLLPDMAGGIEMFFISGIMMVAAATTLVIWNATLATSFIVMLGRRFSRWLPSVKTAVAYPLANKVRTGMTIAMFSLVIFSLVMMAAINNNMLSLLHGENAGGGWNIHVVKSPSNPIPDLVQALEAEGMDTSVIAATGQYDQVFQSRTQVRQTGDAAWGEYTVNGLYEDFIVNSAIPLQVRATGYENDAAVWEAIRNNPNLAVIDSWALPTGGVMMDSPSTLRLTGIQQSDTVMTPLDLDIQDPISGNLQTVTIIGVIDGSVSTMFGVFMPAATFNDIFAQPSMSAFTVRITPEADEKSTAATIKSTLATYGVQTISIEEMIETSAANSRSFLMLFQGFMGLGLVVGIAALGVIAFRSVVERRQQIGMLRAIGFNRRMVAASFMIESSMVTLLGVVSGAALGLWLSWNLLTSDYFLGSGAQTSYIVPWGTVLFFLALSLAASLVMAYIPARNAARVPISQALRYE
jgi:putative ABC transport system permease protein